MRHAVRFCIILVGLNLAAGCGLEVIDSRDAEQEPQREVIGYKAPAPTTGTPPSQDQPEQPASDPPANEDPEEDPDPETDPVPDPQDPVEATIEALYAGDPDTNIGWIGGACLAQADCDYDSGVCWPDPGGYPDGMCTSPCDLYCPDREQGTDTVTFCVEVESEADGTCVSRCNFDLLVDGCRQGYACVPAQRHTEPATIKSACLPAAPDHVPPAHCYAELLVDDVLIDSWNVGASLAAEKLCWVEAPLRLESPVHSIPFRQKYAEAPTPLKVNCRMAQALRDFATLLVARDVVEVVHIGTYNCRTIAGTNRLSQHAFGNAIDLSEFVRTDGMIFDVEDHWEHDTDFPETEQGQFLLDLAYAMAGVFNVVLTPNFNEAHANHFHVDLSPGKSLLKGGPSHYLGPNTGH